MEKFLKQKTFNLGKKSITIPVEALSYGISLFGIASAFTSSLGVFFVFIRSGYIKSTTDAAYAAA